MESLPDFHVAHDNDITSVSHGKVSEGKYSGTAIDQRNRLPYDPIKETRSIRESLRDEGKNGLLKSGNEYTRKKFGKSLELNLESFPESSLRKQYVIGKTYDLAVSGSPEYKKAVYADYSKNQHHLISQSGAKDYDSLVAASYKSASKETGDQFNGLNLRFQFHPGHLNYENSNEMLRDIHLHNNMTVFKGGDRHEYLHNIHPKIGVTDNDIFRAVHDAYGHAIHGNPFGPKGEEIAYHLHSQMYSPLAKIAVASETRGQNSNVNYTDRNIDIRESMEGLRKQQHDKISSGDIQGANDTGKKLREVGHTWRYAEQASVALPPSMLSKKFNGEVPDSVKHLLRDKEADVNPNYDVDKDHLSLVKLARHHNTGSQLLSKESERGVFHKDNALSDLKHIASVHGFTGLTKNPFEGE